MHETSTAITTTAPSASFGTLEETPLRLSWGKLILYHLWDADQHLKSPQVRLPPIY